LSGPLLLDLPWPAPSPALAGFTSTRQGGVSRGAFDSLNLGLNTQDSGQAVLENRNLAFRGRALDPAKAVHLQQVHADRIAEAGTRDAGRGAQDWAQGLPACDAVFTRMRGLPLCIGHADCLAVAVADADAGLIGLAHAGWRGALAGLPGKLALRLIAEGAKPERLQAVLSPCLGPGSLELGEDEHRLFSQAFERTEDFSSSLRQGHFYLNLWACVRRQLIEAGLDGLRIQGQELDTARHPELFYSHRRDQGKTGRMLTVAALI
jgi:YfiH family protein